MRGNTPRLLSIVALVLFAGIGVNAQSTLFNIPSTDTLSPRRVYLEFDFITHLEKHPEGGFQSYIPRVVYGVRRGFEIGVNAAFTDAFAPYQPIEIQPNAKWQFYSNEENGFAATVGGVGYIPVHHRTGTDSFAMVYSNVSKKFKGDFGPRVTGGAYGLIGRDRGFGNRGGGMVGYEQPLGKRASFVADWFSGRNRFGYVTPGISVTVSKRSAFYAGYSIGNQGRKNNGLFLYYGITF